MANANRYYKTPFAESGNRSEVPDISVGGSVGYDSGFGPDYELPQGSPSRKRIERDKYNGVLNGVTKNLKQWQERLYPTWIEDDGEGAAYPYPIGMIVNHNGQSWASNEDANQEEPGAGTKWDQFEPLRHDLLTQESLNAAGGHDAIYSRAFSGVSEMVGYTSHVLGNRYSTGGTSWLVNDNESTALRQRFALGEGLYAVSTTPLDPRDWGVIGNGVVDDYLAYTDCVRFANPYPIAPTSFSEIAASLTMSGETINIRGLLIAHSQTIIHPAYLKITGDTMFFRRNPTSGFVYTGPDDSPAHATLIYKKVSPSLYEIHTDINEVPTGVQIDAGDYVGAASGLSIDLMSVLTKPTTKLGMYWVGATGGYTKGLAIGEGEGGASADRYPLCGMLHASAWGCEHQQTRVCAGTQGLHVFSSNAGTAFYSPYVAEMNNVGNDADVPLYPVASAVGSLGISVKDSVDVSFFNPIIEHFYNMYVTSNAKTHLTRTHFESAGNRVKHSYYLADNSSCVIDGVTWLDQSFTNPLSSVFYFENQQVNKCSVKAVGHSSKVGNTLVLGSGSGAVLTIDGVDDNQLNFGKIGDLSLVASIGNLPIEVVYISTTNPDANSQNWGTIARPFQTFGQALAFANKFGKTKKFTINNQTSAVANDAFIVEAPDLTLTGVGDIDFGAGGLEYNRGVYRLRTFVTMSTTRSQLVHLNGDIDLTHRSHADINSGYAVYLFKDMGNVKMYQSEAAGVDLSTINRYADTATPNKPTGTFSGASNVPVSKCPTTIATGGINTTTFINGY